MSLSVGNFGTLFGRHAGSDGHVLVFQVYLDDSGTSDSPVVTMAGFLASDSDWAVLEPKLEGMLARHSVDVLHAKEFHDTKGCFSGWSRIRKRSFTNELFDICRDHVKVGFSLSADKKSHQDNKDERRISSSSSAYGVCFGAILMAALQWPGLGRVFSQKGISFLIEDGNHNNAHVQKVYQAALEFDRTKGAMRGLAFIPKSHCRAIQVADFYAFHSRRTANDLNRFAFKLALPRSDIHQRIHERILLHENCVFGEASSVPEERVPFDGANQPS